VGGAPAKPAIRVEPHKQIKTRCQSGVLAESTNERLAKLANPNSVAESRKRHLFLPLVRKGMTASLDVLMLRGGHTSRLVIEGDIGNRLKTLFDAPSVPRPEQVPPVWSPAEDQKPLFCLLAAYQLITESVRGPTDGGHHLPPTGCISSSRSR